MLKEPEITQEMRFRYCRLGCFIAKRTGDHSGDEVQVCRLGCFNAERTEYHLGDEVQVLQIGVFQC